MFQSNFQNSDPENPHRFSSEKMSVAIAGNCNFPTQSHTACGRSVVRCGHFCGAHAVEADLNSVDFPITNFSRVLKKVLESRSAPKSRGRAASPVAVASSSSKPHHHTKKVIDSESASASAPPPPKSDKSGKKHKVKVTEYYSESASAPPQKPSRVAKSTKTTADRTKATVISKALKYACETCGRDSSYQIGRKTYCGYHCK